MSWELKAVKTAYGAVTAAAAAAVGKMVRVREVDLVFPVFRIRGGPRRRETPDLS